MGELGVCDVHGRPWNHKWFEFFPNSNFIMQNIWNFFYRLNIYCQKLLEWDRSMMTLPLKPKIMEFFRRVSKWQFLTVPDWLNHVLSMEWCAFCPFLCIFRRWRLFEQIVDTSPFFYSWHCIFQYVVFKTSFQLTTRVSLNQLEGDAKKLTHLLLTASILKIKILNFQFIFQKIQTLSFPTRYSMSL